MATDLIHLNELLFSFSKALDFVEAEVLGVSSNHGKRVAYLCMRICKQMGFGNADVFDIASCAVLHDNALTKYMLHSHKDIKSLENLRIHCQIGEENVRHFPFLNDVKGVILYHHENWDGSGFYRLKEHYIPVKASILRLADNMDLALHMGDGRPELESEIRKHLAENKEKLYSPAVVAAFETLLNEAFLQDISDARIDASLHRDLPKIERYLSTQELLQVCNVFATIVDSKSHFTKTHSQGVAEKGAHMGKIFGFDQIHCNELKISGYLHDIGKLAIPLSILEKPGPLTDEEYKVMQTHIAFTWEILQNVRGLRDICVWAANHHERLDGSGYHYATGANGLDFNSRLMACCDVYQALTEDRPYRFAMQHDDAIRLMSKLVQQGKIDGKIVAAIDREGKAGSFAVC